MIDQNLQDELAELKMELRYRKDRYAYAMEKLETINQSLVELLTSKYYLKMPAYTMDVQLLKRCEAAEAERDYYKSLYELYKNVGRNSQYGRA